MYAVLARRSDIYEFFHASATCQSHFFAPSHEVEFTAYTHSMYLLQDTTESLWAHRQKGFAGDPHRAYLELWGLMQAVIIQQDAIKEVFAVVLGRLLDSRQLTKWHELRQLRNLCAGHPARRDPRGTLPLARCFMARGFGGYERFQYEQWEQGVGTTYPSINLGQLLDEYAVEATGALTEVLAAMRHQWPTTPGQEP